MHMLQATINSTHWNISVEKAHTAIYTDGSKSSSGVGFAAVSTNTVIQFSLPIHASVFSAELMAILAAVDIIKNNPPQKCIIFSDSRSAVEALKAYSSKNPLVLKIRTLLHEIHITGKQVEICWIPAHVDTVLMEMKTLTKQQNRQ